MSATGGGVRSGGGAVTVSVAGASCVAMPAVPVTLNMMSPGVVSYAVWMVSVLVPAPVTDAGLNVLVTPEGKPVAVSATACAMLPAGTASVTV